MKKNLLMTLFAVLFVVSAATIVFAANQDWKLVIRVNGDVQSQTAQDPAWHTIWQSQVLKNGDKAKTGSDSRAKIRLADQTVITVGEKTVVQMSEFSMDKDSRKANFKLFSGKIRLNVGKFFSGSNTDIKVETPSAVLAARGTDFYVEQEKDTKQSGFMSPLTVMVFEGAVNVNTTGQNFYVNAGDAFILGSNGIGTIVPISQVPSIQTAAAGQAAKGGDADLTGSSFNGAPKSLFFESSPPPITPPVPTTPICPIINPSTVTTGSLPIVIQ